MAEACDRYGFFNGILGLEQSNWANYWKGIIPDGVIAQQANEMEVYTPTYGEGMFIRVKTGQAMIDNHRVWITVEKKLPIAEHSPQPRIDLVVLRVTYGNSGESTVEIDVKPGTPASTPHAPTCTAVTGGTYEIPLAKVNVSETAETILPSNIIDMRYVYKLGNDSVTTFNGTEITVKNDIEYRSSTAVENLTINLPDSPNDTFITGVCFSTTSNFTGVTFRKGGNAYSDMKVVGDSLQIPSRRYNLIIWWDSGFEKYWCAVKAVTL